LSGIGDFFCVIGLQQHAADVKFSDGRSIRDDQRQVLQQFESRRESRSEFM
jgi:hypothetical protein